MSYGVVCLVCRHYVWHEKLGEDARGRCCDCASLGIKPRPSLDARTDATPEQVARYWRAEHDRYAR